MSYFYFPNIFVLSLSKFYSFLNTARDDNYVQVIFQHREQAKDGVMLLRQLTHVNSVRLLTVHARQ